ncbi:Sec1-like protein [Parachaetomium inaequale]|uniref:Sec1-like protein n=1 Tax=Parachaetomium inaequale TaxID=2588326 RepID=A0AAN6SUH7_9PEZI|nr:Sec1-like protein [Parachaetomium inaequale]
MAPRAGFDTEQVRDKARKDLLHLLEGVRGKKNLVIEKELAGPLGVVVKASTLRDYGVDNFFFLENKNTDTSQRNVVFIARGESARNAHAIADQIIRLQRESQSPHEFHIFWVPRRTLLSDKVLEEAGVLGDTNVAELPLFFFPLENDVLSLELNDSFRDLYLAKDPTSVFLLARALMGIQQKHGLFPRIIGKGDNAKRVADLLLRMRQELLAGEDAGEAGKTGLSPSTTIENVIIIDREVDFVTPLLTQLTYEGLLDEVFGIQNNQTDVDSTIVGAAAQPAGPGTSAAAPPNNAQSRKRKIQLDGSDTLFAQLRDANFAIVGGLLNKIARRLQGDLESRHSSKTTAELKEFVKKLPGYQAEQQSLKIHTGMAEEIIKYTRTENFNKLLEVQQNLAAGADPSSQFDAIEELIARDTPLPQVLRLLCIYSCISGGIKTKELDHFRRLILQGYGYQHLLTLHNLERLQMFLSRASPLASMIPMTAAAGAQGTMTNYTYLRKQLRLIVDEVNEHDPNDIAYVYSGYAPLSVRLVQCVLQKQYVLSITRGSGGGAGGASGPAAGGGAQGWRGFDDAVKHARGQTFDEVQKGEDKAVKARALLSGSGDRKTVFVVFVGGISFTEIAALRFLAKQEEARRNIVICTTPAKPPSPPASTASDPDAAPKAIQHDPANGSEDIAPEIVVWTEEMDSMVVDSPESATPTTPAPAPAVEEKAVTTAPPSPAPPPSTTLSIPIQNGTPVKESSSLSSLSSHKATTPVDVDSSREAPAPGVARPSQTTDSPRRKWDVRPKVSIPPDLPLSELNPYSLHQEEYLMLRDHISHTQVTTYLNIRNGILRLWEAVGCAKDPRWFDVASVCFEWLIRRGYINFGKQNDSSPRKRKTVVVIGAGMSGLGCARQLEGFMGEEPPQVVVLEGRDRSRPKHIPAQFEGKRFTAEMGGMIITGGQLGLAYHLLRPETTLYDSSGKPVDLHRDQLYKFKQPTSKLIEGNRDLIDEGKDSSAETHKTIRQAEESAAAQPYAAPVSEQNIAPQVNLVPPGTPGALKAAHKAKTIGWTLKQGTATKEPGATLGSVTDKVIAQYRDLLDLTAQDFRLMNWHIANLEYSNATNYHQLSLQGHSMVVGGYQSVPRGLMHLPTPLNVKQKSPVSNITYTSGSPTGAATVTCEDGSTVEADFVVSTIPLGVLKHGNVKFEPPLPPWKSDAIDRLGFGVLNKVILVYKEPFWDEDRDIFGVLRNPTNRHSLDQKDYASQRGRFFQWFNITKTSGLPVLLALMAGDAGFDTEQTCNDDLVAEATEILRSVYGSRVPHPIEAVVTRWASDKFARGSYSSAGPDMKADDYDTMARPIGNLFFAGEHTCGTHPATVHGAYLSGLRAASEVLDAMLGPIPVPSPLILPKDSSSLLGGTKRKASALLEGMISSSNNSHTSKDPALTRLEADEARLWEHIVTQLGPRPLAPPKPATNAYIFYSKAHYEDARRRLEAGRRPASKGGNRPSANEVRVMNAKMWRDASEAERKPFVEMAEEQKRGFGKAMEAFRAEVGEWDAKAAGVRERWVGGDAGSGGGIGGGDGGSGSGSGSGSDGDGDGEGVPTPAAATTGGGGDAVGKGEEGSGGEGDAAGGKGEEGSGAEGRRSRVKVESYAEVDSDVEVEGEGERGEEGRGDGDGEAMDVDVDMPLNEAEGGEGGKKGEAMEE